MYRTPLFLFLLGLSFSLTAQNLVPNPSFELIKGTIKKPPYRNMPIPHEEYSGNTPFVKNVNFWFSANYATPDLRVLNKVYYSSCKSKRQDCDMAKTGDYALGLITFMDNQRSPNNREYIQIELKEPLQPGKETFVELWIINEKWSRQVSNNIGFYFSERRVLGEHKKNINVTPQYNHTAVIRRKEEWTLIKGSFIPDKPFTYVTIGNFYNNEETEYDNVKVYKGPSYFGPKAYYLIDDVAVYQNVQKETIPKKPISKPAVIKYKEEPVAIGTVIALKNVEFDTNSDVLKPESYKELNELIGWLHASTAVIIGIYGHTDNVGTDAHNLELSMNRARRIFDYLQSKGISNTRMTFKGFGERQPIAENTTETGRKQNRRVEFQVLSK